MIDRFFSFFLKEIFQNKQHYLIQTNEIHKQQLCINKLQINHKLTSLNLVCS